MRVARSAEICNSKDGFRVARVIAITRETIALHGEARTILSNSAHFDNIWRRPPSRNAFCDAGRHSG